jgi:hypothetical protein
VRIREILQSASRRRRVDIIMATMKLPIPCMRSAFRPLLPTAIAAVGAIALAGNASAQ